MTGNTSKWRAPLAGLASIAMLATMGVAASTANAYPTVNEGDGFKVAVFPADRPYEASKYYDDYKYGQTFELNALPNPYSSATDGKILTGYSYDLAGKNVVKDAFAVKGDTKVYAQYAKAYTVTFDTNANGKADSSDKQVEVQAGAALTDAKAYWTSGAEAAAETAKPSGDVFAGWKLSTAADVDDLYTNQAINSDITLYPVYERYSSKEDQQNVSVVNFHQNGAETEYTKTLYTLANKAFPEFRAYYSYQQDQWQAPLGTKYDFTAPVANSNQTFGKPDLTIYGVKGASNKDWTVEYDFDGANATNDSGRTSATTSEKYFAEGTAAEQPSDPAKKGAQFTGWFVGTTKVDFSKNVESLPGADASTRTVKVKAGWATKNVVPVVFYYGYNRTSPAPWNNYSYPTTSAEANNKVLSKTGKAIDYVVAGTALTAPANLEQYFQTAADKAHGTWTSQSVTGWYAVNDDAPITTVPAGATGIEVYAKWSSSFAVKLNGNGGSFKNGTNYAYATVADGKTLQDVVETPTRSGYNFLFWASAVDSSKYANLYDVHWYSYTGKQGAEIADGEELVAQWAPASVEDAVSLHNRFGLTGVHKTADVQTVADAGYTDASAKAYVDAWYNLQN
ncbi:InlB B-repeat-containing protein, partial [Bifidobacterium sp. MA2]